MAQLPKGGDLQEVMINQDMGVAIAIGPFQVVFMLIVTGVFAVITYWVNF